MDGTGNPSFTGWRPQGVPQGKECRMAIFRFRDRVIFFAHVPKCGGTSVEVYLRAIGQGALGFVDDTYLATPAEKRWNVSSPQHIDGESLARLFPPDFFDEFLAVVRDPIRRFRSAFTFQKLVERTIDPALTASAFAMSLTPEAVSRTGWMDNHFLPQTRFLYPNRPHRAFKLELGGMAELKDYLDSLLVGAPLARQMPHANNSDPLRRSAEDPAAFELDAAAEAHLAELYACDYETFGFDRAERAAPAA